MEAALAHPPPDGFERRVLVLTDGAVNNTRAVKDMVATRAPAVRSVVFTIGIGPNVSHGLVDGLATAGRGTADYVQLEERLEPVVMRQMRRASRPSPPVVEHIEWLREDSDWDMLLPESGGGMMEDATQVGRLCDGQRILVGALVNSSVRAMRLHFVRGNERATLDVPLGEVDAASNLRAAVGHALVEQAEAVPETPASARDARVEALGLQMKILTRRTSLVATDVEFPDRPIATTTHYPCMSPEEEDDDVSMPTFRSLGASPSPHRLRTAV